MNTNTYSAECINGCHWQDQALDEVEPEPE